VEEASPILPLMCIVPELLPHMQEAATPEVPRAVAPWALEDGGKWTRPLLVPERAMAPWALEDGEKWTHPLLVAVRATDEG
jgi:hypothetical protein